VLRHGRSGSKLVESDDANNCGSVVVDLTALATTEPRATLRGTGPACLA
jgi:hypothetical protein